MLALIATIAFASVFPCRGEAAVVVDGCTNAGIALLFFLHGAKLSREAIVAAATHWRLHALVLLTTFAVFPLLGLAFRPLLSPLVTPALYTGVLFLCTLPSTVQSSIAFTSMAKGNVPAAVCSASASSLLGIFVTPAVASLVLSSHAASGSPWHTIASVTLQLFVPFLCGQLLRPAIGAWIERHRSLIRVIDEGSILLIVYSAFSEAIAQGLWHQVPLSALAGLVAINVILLAAALVSTLIISKWLGFDRADRITIVFCGSKKSLSFGITVARVLFTSHAVGAAVLPLMLFHQIQLLVCAALAKRWGAVQQAHERESIARETT